MSYSVRSDLAGEMDRLREAMSPDDHHFYGAWHGARRGMALPPQLHQAMQSVAQRGDASKREYSIALDANGNVTHDVEGDAHRVSFPDDVANGAQVHNHPTISGISDADIKTAIKGNMASLHVVGPTLPGGTRYRYSIYRPEAGWPHISRDKWKDAELRGSFALMKYTLPFDGKPASDAKTLAKAAGAHAWLTAVLSYLGIDYEREPWVPLREAAADDDTHHFYGAWHGPRVSKSALRAHGQAPARFGPIDHLPEPEQQAITGALGQLADRTENERAIAVMPDGKVIIDKVGGAREVEFSDAEVEHMANAHLVHNHPTGSPLSNDDISLAALHNFAGISAVGTDVNGAQWRFSLLRPKNGWPSVGGQPDRYGLATAFAKGHVVGEDRWRSIMQQFGEPTDRPTDSSALDAWLRDTQRATVDAMNLDRAAVAAAIGAQYERVAWH